MNRKTFIVILAAIGLGIGAYLVVQGIRGSKPKTVRAGNAKMEAAMASARNSVDTFITQLAAPQQNWRYLVKFRIEQNGRVEHIWAEPVAYDNGTFRGIIANEPYRIKSLDKGDTVAASKNAISDWMIIDTDGDTQGGWTEKALK